MMKHPDTPRAGFFPASLVIGDFNEDGNPDLAVAARFSTAQLPDEVPGGVFVLLGDGLGGFSEAPGSPIPTGEIPFSITIGKFDSDGHLDLAVANERSHHVTILLGDGMGGFREAQGSPILVGEGPRAVTVGDLNDDRRLDLVVANRGDDTVSVLLGDGMDHFTETSDSPILVGELPSAVAIGDLNGDRHPDLVVANRSPADLTVLLGNGTGRFVALLDASPEIGGRPVAVTIGDLDEDGRLDFAVANLTSNIVILLGDGG